MHSISIDPNWLSVYYFKASFKEFTKKIRRMAVRHWARVGPTLAHTYTFCLFESDFCNVRPTLGQFTLNTMFQRGS